MGSTIIGFLARVLGEAIAKAVSDWAAQLSRDRAQRELGAEQAARAAREAAERQERAAHAAAAKVSADEADTPDEFMRRD